MKKQYMIVNNTGYDKEVEVLSVKFVIYGEKKIEEFWPW